MLYCPLQGRLSCCFETAARPGALKWSKKEGDPLSLLLLLRACLLLLLLQLLPLLLPLLLQG
jgi:hypothetical protein